MHWSVNDRWSIDWSSIDWLIIDWLVIDQSSIDWSSIDWLIIDWLLVGHPVYFRYFRRTSGRLHVTSGGLPVTSGGLPDHWPQRPLVVRTGTILNPLAGKSNTLNIQSAISRVLLVLPTSFLYLRIPLFVFLLLSHPIWQYHLYLAVYIQESASSLLLT